MSHQRFYSSSESGSESSSSESESSSSEDLHLATFMRLEGVVAPTKTSSSSLAAPLPATTPLACHDKPKRKTLEEEYEDEGLLAPLPLECGKPECLKKKRERALRGYGEPIGTVLPAVTEYKSAAPTTAPTTTVAKSAATPLSTNAFSFDSIVLPETEPLGKWAIPSSVKKVFGKDKKKKEQHPGNDNLKKKKKGFFGDEATTTSSSTTMADEPGMDLGHPREWHERHGGGGRGHHYGRPGWHRDGYYRPWWPFWSKAGDDTGATGGALGADLGSEFDAEEDYSTGSIDAEVGFDQAEWHKIKRFVETNYPEKSAGTTTATQAPVAPESDALTQLKASHAKLEERLAQMEKKYASGALKLEMVQPLGCHESGRRKKNGGALKSPLSDPRLCTLLKGESTASPVPPTPELKSVAVSFPNTQLQRLAAQLASADAVPDQGMRELLLSGKLAANLAAVPTELAASDAPSESIFAHLCQSHGMFYRLLRDNGLLPLLHAQQDLVLIVPDEPTLETITNRVSDETAQVLRYHALIVPVARPIKLVAPDQVSEYTALGGSPPTVQVEKRGECVYANGHHMHSDIYWPTRLFHISGLLDASQLLDTSMPPQDLPPPLPAPMDQAEEPAATEESTSDASSTEPAQAAEPAQPDGVDDTGPPPQQYWGNAGDDDEWEDDSGSQTSHRLSVVPSAAFTLRSFSKTGATQPQNPAVQRICAGMDKLFFSSAFELKSYVDTGFTPLDAAVVSVRTYDPAPLFRQYQARALPDLARLRAEAPVQRLSVAPAEQRRLDIGNKQSVSEFALHAERALNSVRKADLLAGLTELSFPAPGGSGLCVLLCKFQASETDASTYYNEEENLMLRFHGNVLDTVSVNLGHAAMPAASPASDAPHFLEWHTTDEERRALYARALNRDEFQAAMLGKSKIVRFLKKKASQAARYVKRQTGRTVRRVLNRADAEKKKASAMRVRALPLQQLSLLEKLDELEGGLKAVTVQLTLTAYDKAMATVQDASVESADAQKYFYKWQGESVVGYVLDAAPGLAARLANGVQYLDVRSNLETLAFNFGGVKVDAAQAAYYGTKGDALHILVFDADSGALQRVLSLKKGTKLIAGLAL